MKPFFAKSSWALVILIASLAECVHSAEADEKKSGASPGGLFRIEEVSDKSLGIWEGDRPVLVYNHREITNPSLPNARSRSAYLHPIFGLDGEVLTDDFPKDHVYHRGLYWAWSHIKVGDQEYDTWSLRGIRYEFQRWLARETSSDKAVIGVENTWMAGSKAVMKEKLLIQAHRAAPNHRAIDVELVWTPTDQPVALQGAEGKSYGGFTLRFGPRSKTIITTPSGRTTDDLLMTKLPWADFSGDLGGRGDLSGIAIFVHPSHPDFPPTWMTRHYGVLAVGWPGVTPQTLQPGQSVTCRYRLWVHRSATEATVIQRAYEQYREMSGGK